MEGRGRDFYSNASWDRYLKVRLPMWALANWRFSMTRWGSLMGSYDSIVISGKAEIGWVLTKEGSV